MANAAIEDIDLPTVIRQINQLMCATAPEANGPVTVSQQAMTDRWQAIINEVLELRNLGDDWDGLGAKAPSTALIESAVELAQTLQNYGFRLPCRAVPGPDGEILLEWQERGIYLEAEVCKPHTAEWMLVLADGTANHWVTPSTDPSAS
jgi:hypothetical protein